MPVRLAELFTTGTTFASTAATHTTVNQRKANETPGDVSDGNASSSLGSGLRDCRLLFRLGTGHWLVLKREGQYWRRLLHGRPRNDRVGCGPEFSFCEPGRAGIDGLGWFGLSVRHSSDSLVLDRRHSSHVVPRAGDDAVLLHFQDPLRAGISEAAFR